MSKGLLYPYSLIYVIFAYAVLNELGYLGQSSFQGWIAVSIAALIGILLMKPVEAIGLRMGKLNTAVRNIVFLENIAIIVVAYLYGHNLLVALVGLVLIAFTIFLGSISWKR